jgi:PAS domain S-box-containing protein
VASELDLEKAVQLVTDAATELTGAAFGSFFYNVLNDAGESYMLYTLSGAPMEAFSKFPMPRNSKVFGPTFTGESVVRSDDITKDPRYGKSPPHYGQPKGHLPVRSYLAVPVISRSSEVLGGLFFGHPQPGKFLEEHEELVVGVAAYAGIAIDNARLYGAAQKEIERRKAVEEALKTEASRQADAALVRFRESERVFQLLVQSVTDYAIYMLDPSGVVSSWNAGASRIKGYVRDEILGRNYAEFFTPEDRERNVPANALRIAGEQGRYESEGWRIRKDGTRFWAFAVIDAVRDEGGKLIGFAKITRDMSERREAQLELERAREQLAQAQKMEAIGQLTGGIAHDFNNLLMIVSGQAQLLRNRAKEAKDVRALDAIEMAAKNGANLTRQLLTFARRQRLNPELIDLEARVRAFHDLLESSLGGAVQFTTEMKPDLWPVEVDVGEFELALVNIAVNARDAMPGGGTLRLAAENVTLQRMGGVPLTGDFVVLSLADTGTGIAPEAMEKIFEPFFTTKEVGKGTGLGLSQVYGFARQSGGDVTVTSDVGTGTTVNLYLPRARGKPSHVNAQVAPAATVHGSGVVLMVEDNAQVAEVCGIMLEQMGYEVLRADCPAQALAVLDARDDIRLVFSDIVMPGAMDGLTLATAIREKYPDLPVLLATGYSSAAERAGLTFPILRKPYEAETLGAALKQALSAAVSN